MSVIIYNKNVGETPLECLDRWKSENKEYVDVPMTYAGRLDPLASGVMIFLAGEEIKNKDKYIGLSKEYECEILLGFETDTYDVLGIPNPRKNSPCEGEDVCKISNEILHTELDKLMGKNTYPYPPYSSKTVNGKPLFEYARNGEIDTIEIPTREMELKSFEIMSERKISNDEISEYVKDITQIVKGDFRQEEILNKWQEILNNKNHIKKEYQIFKVSFFVSSGTYIRTLVHILGESMGIGAVVFSLKRTRLGIYTK